MSCFLVRDNHIIDLSGTSIERAGVVISIESVRGDFVHTIVSTSKEKADLLWSEIKNITRRNNIK